MFFENAFRGGGGGGGLGGSPSAFASPGLDQNALAMLMAMQKQSGQGTAMPGGPQLSMPQKAGTNVTPPPAMPGPQMPQPAQQPVQQPGQAGKGIMQMLSWLGLGGSPGIGGLSTDQIIQRGGT